MSTVLKTATEKCIMKRVQHKKSTTKKMCNMKWVRHGAMRKECNVNSAQCEEKQQQKWVPWKE